MYETASIYAVFSEVQAHDPLVFSVVHVLQFGLLLDNINVLVLHGLDLIVRIQQVHLVPVVDEVELLDSDQFVIDFVADVLTLNVKEGIVQLFKNLLQFENLH